MSSKNRKPICKVLCYISFGFVNAYVLPCQALTTSDRPIIVLAAAELTSPKLTQLVSDLAQAESALTAIKNANPSLDTLNSNNNLNYQAWTSAYAALRKADSDIAALTTILANDDSKFVNCQNGYFTQLRAQIGFPNGTSDGAIWDWCHKLPYTNTLLGESRTATGFVGFFRLVGSEKDRIQTYRINELTNREATASTTYSSSSLALTERKTNITNAEKRVADLKKFIAEETDKLTQQLALALNEEKTNVAKESAAVRTVATAAAQGLQQAKDSAARAVANAPGSSAATEAKTAETSAEQIAGIAEAAATDAARLSANAQNVTSLETAKSLRLEVASKKIEADKALADIKTQAGLAEAAAKKADALKLKAEQEALAQAELTAKIANELKTARAAASTADNAARNAEALALKAQSDAKWVESNMPNTDYARAARQAADNTQSAAKNARDAYDRAALKVIEIQQATTLAIAEEARVSVQNERDLANIKKGLAQSELDNVEAAKTSARTEIDRLAQEKMAKEAQEKAVKEAEEKADKEAKEKADKEAKEKAEEQAKKDQEAAAAKKLLEAKALAAAKAALPTTAKLTTARNAANSSRTRCNVAKTATAAAKKGKAKESALAKQRTICATVAPNVAAYNTLVTQIPAMCAARGGSSSVKKTCTDNLRKTYPKM